MLCGVLYDQLSFATCPRQLHGLYAHVSITINILSFAIKIIYFQISSNEFLVAGDLHG
jgi:hypothetical protein